MDDHHSDLPDDLITLFSATLASRIAHPELRMILKAIPTSDGTPLADKTMAEGLIMVGKAEGLMLEYPGESYRPPQVAAIITDGKLAEAALSLPADNSEWSQAVIDQFLPLLVAAVSESANPPVLVLESDNSRGKNTVRRLLAFASAVGQGICTDTGERRFFKINPERTDPIFPDGHSGVQTIIGHGWLAELDEAPLSPKELDSIKFLVASKGKGYRVPCNDSPAATGTAQTDIPKEPTDGRLYWVRGFYEKPRKVDAETARRMSATGQTGLCTPVMDDEDGEQG